MVAEIQTQLSFGMAQFKTSHYYSQCVLEEFKQKKEVFEVGDIVQLLRDLFLPVATNKKINLQFKLFTLSFWGDAFISPQSENG